MKPRQGQTRKTRKNKHKEFLNANRHLYEELLKAQGGTCALCPTRPSSRRKLDLDHDHRRMVVRGLLCHVCNRKLDSRADRAWLLRAAEYVGRTYVDDVLIHGPLRGRMEE